MADRSNHAHDRGRVRRRDGRISDAERRRAGGRGPRRRLGGLEEVVRETAVRQLSAVEQSGRRTDVRAVGVFVVVVFAAVVAAAPTVLTLFSHVAADAAARVVDAERPVMRVGPPHTVAGDHQNATAVAARVVAEADGTRRIGRRHDVT